jgi:hypothetical protein
MEACSNVKLDFMLHLTAWSDSLLVFSASKCFMLPSQFSIILRNTMFCYPESHVRLWNSAFFWFYNSFTKVLHL